MTFCCYRCHCADAGAALRVLPGGTAYPLELLLTVVTNRPEKAILTRAMTQITDTVRRSREYRVKELEWRGRELRLKSGRLLATVEPDCKWPKMFRVRLRDGSLSDMANLTRAKDAARQLVLADLNRPASPVDGPGFVCTAPRPKSAPCHDCGVDTAPASGKRGAILKSDLGKWEWYMVKDDVWAAAGMVPDGGYLCIGCLEDRLGRQITRADFKYPWKPDDTDSDRLRDRLKR